MYRKRAPPPPLFTFDANHMETVELEDASSEYDSDDMNILNTSTALSIDRIRSSDEDTDDEVQSLEVDLIRRRCTNVMQLNRTEINFDRNPLSEAEDSPTSPKHQHCERSGPDPDFLDGNNQPMSQADLETQPASPETNTDQFHRLNESTITPSSTNSDADSNTASSSNNSNSSANSTPSSLPSDHSQHCRHLQRRFNPGNIQQTTP